MMKKSALFACALLAMPMAAEAREKEANTPSGRAEMVFAGVQLSDAVTSVSSACMDRGWMITSQINNQVVCEIPLGIWQSAFTQMMIGNSYSTPPKSFVRVSLAQVGEHTRAQTQSWAETQMAFGQLQHHQYQDDGTYNNMLTFLAQAGAQFPVGTTFTSAAYLGVEGEDATWQSGRRRQYGHVLTKVTERAPAHAWGAKAGDIVAKVNNRTFRDDAGFVALLNRQRVGQPMTITVVRDGQEIVLSGTAKGRPTITTLVRPSDVPAGQLPVAMQIAAAHLGSVDAAREVVAAADIGSTTEPVTTAMAASAAGAPASAESDLERMRREAAEAQARLAKAEAEAAGAAVSDGAAEPAGDMPGR